MRLNRFWIEYCVGMVMILGSACAPAPEPADLVIRGGTVVTMDPENPEVEALAARGQTIVAVGNAAEIAPLIGSETEVLELDGAVAYPGLIEGHAHFLSLGRATMQLNLREAVRWDDVVSAVAEAAAKAEPGQWIRGRGWHQDKWTEPPTPNVEGMPVHDALSAVSPANPVFLSHASGHAAIVNAVAMELAGIGPNTENPEGGEILRDHLGRPTGLLLERAEELLTDLMAEDSEPEIRRQVEAATRECLRYGICSFQDAGSTLREVEILKRMAEAGELSVRLWLMLDEDNEVIAPVLDTVSVRGVGGGFLTVGGIKRYMDGALGSRGAWLLDPYADAPGSAGLRVTDQDTLRESARLALQHGLQLCIHAIGDRANREVLDLYEESLGLHGHERRWRIEHAQHLQPCDVSRFGALGVIAAMQPTHCVSDGPWVADRLGPQRARATSYMWRALIDRGALIVSGTDAPVESVDPIATFHAAVTREMENGERFNPEQCMSRIEALRASTIQAAYAVFEERLKGSLEPGKYADLTILERDLRTVDEDEILSARVLNTVVGGRIRFSSDE